MRAFFALAFATVLGFIIASACTPTQRAAGRAVVSAVDAACVEIGESGGVICATAEELAPFAKLILRSRKMAAAAAASAAESAAACPSPGKAPPVSPATPAGS